MKKWLMTAALVAVAVLPLRADLTVVQTMTMEGPMAAMAGGQTPKMTMRIKGQKARYEMEMPQMSMISITDLALKQVIVLNPQMKTAQIMTPGSVKSVEAPPMPKIDASFTPTGKSQTIEGQACDEHRFVMTMDMSEMGGGQGQMPAEAAEMMKGVKMVMNGSVWIAKSAPGAAEYVAFNKAAVDANLFAALSGMKPGQSGGMDKVFSAVASAPGIPYLMEITMTVEGTGPMVDAMKQMGGMKMVQKVTSVSTAAVPDDLFKVPDGYKMEKK